jgi:hypothetical protein
VNDNVTVDDMREYIKLFSTVKKLCPEFSDACDNHLRVIQELISKNDTADRIGKLTSSLETLSRLRRPADDVTTAAGIQDIADAANQVIPDSENAEGLPVADMVRNLGGKALNTVDTAISIFAVHISVDDRPEMFRGFLQAVKELYPYVNPTAEGTLRAKHTYFKNGYGLCTLWASFQALGEDTAGCVAHKDGMSIVGQMRLSLTEFGKLTTKFSSGFHQLISEMTTLLDQVRESESTKLIEAIVKAGEDLKPIAGGCKPDGGSSVCKVRLGQGEGDHVQDEPLGSGCEAY